MNRPHLNRLKRYLIWRHYAGKCGICGGEVAFDACEIDHIIPFKITGRSLLPELQPAHATCNRKKGATYMTTRFKTFTASTVRPRIADAVEVIVQRVKDGQTNTAIVKPPRTGKSNVIRLAAIELRERGLIGGAIVLSPWVFLRDQIIGEAVDAMIEQFIVNTPDISVTSLVGRQLTPGFTTSVPAHLYSMTLGYARSPANLTILVDEAKLCVARGQPLVVFIDEAHTVRNEPSGWGEIAGKLHEAGAHLVLLTGTPERADNIEPYGFRTQIVTHEENNERVVIAGKGAEPNTVRLQRRRFAKTEFSLIADFTMTLREAWNAGILCRVMPRWQTVLVDGQPLIDVEDNVLREVTRDEGWCRVAAQAFVTDIAIRRRARSTSSGIVFVGDDRGTGPDEHAKQLRRIIEEEWRKKFGRPGRITIATMNVDQEATRNEEKAAQVIADFQEGKTDVLIVKGMGGVGLDVKHCKTLLDASTVLTTGATTQRWLRVATLWGDLLHCSLILPDARGTRAMYDEIVTKNGGTLTTTSDIEVLEEWEVPVEDGDDHVLTNPADAGSSDMEINFTVELRNRILRAREMYPALAKLSDAEIAELLNEGQLVVDDIPPGQDSEPEPAAASRVSNPARESKGPRERVVKLAKSLANAEADYPNDKDGWRAKIIEWQAMAKNHAGIRVELSACIDVAKLKAAAAFLEEACDHRGIRYDAA